MREELLKRSMLGLRASLMFTAPTLTASLSESRILEIGREELAKAKARQSFQPGGGAKPGPKFGGEAK